MAPKSEPKSMLPLKRKNQLNASPLAPNWVRGVQVGSKNRSKIDPKMESRWEGILASIFNGFWLIFGSKLGRKIEPRSIQNRCKKASKKSSPPGLSMQVGSVLAGVAPQAWSGRSATASRSEHICCTHGLSLHWASASNLRTPNMAASHISLMASTTGSVQ